MPHAWEGGGLDVGLRVPRFGCMPNGFLSRLGPELPELIYQLVVKKCGQPRGGSCEAVVHDLIDPLTPARAAFGAILGPMMCQVGGRPRNGLRELLGAPVHLEAQRDMDVKSPRVQDLKLPNEQARDRVD